MSGTTDIAVRNGHAPAQQQTGALAIYAGQTAWTDMQLAALTQLGIKDASDGDKAVFLHQCQRTGLDPFSRQIYMIGRPEKKSEKRGSQWVDTWTTKWTIQTGIDGFRVNRARAERQAGVRGTLGRALFYDGEGNEYKVWFRPEPPAACEITYTVKDANGETPYTSVLRYSEYVQLKDSRPVAQWASKPAHMLEKCTEADVYRKAFPQDFSGMHLDDAMPLPEDAPTVAPERQRVSADQIRQRQTVTATAETVTPDAASGDAPPAPAPEAPSTPDERPPALAASGQVSLIQRHFRRLGIEPDTEDGWQAMLTAAARITGLAAIASLQELTQDEAARVIGVLKARTDGETGARELTDLLDDGVVPDGE